MPILIDGNNLLHRLDPQSRSRDEVRRLVLEATRGERVRVIVVFDGAPPTGRQRSEHLGNVTVRYSEGTTADNVIIRQLSRGAAARDWVVVTDDRGLADRVRRAGATVRSVDQWRHRRSPRPRRLVAEPKLTAHDITDWERFFEEEREPESG